MEQYLPHSDRENIAILLLKLMQIDKNNVKTVAGHVSRMCGNSSPWLGKDFPYAGREWPGARLSSLPGRNHSGVYPTWAVRSTKTQGRVEPGENSSLLPSCLRERRSSAQRPQQAMIRRVTQEKSQRNWPEPEVLGALNQVAKNQPLDGGVSCISTLLI